MTILLKTEALEVRAGDRQLVAPLSIELRAGQVLTIIGETGSGKSLFAQAVVGNLPAGLHAHGRITLGDDLCEEGQAQGRHALWGKTLAVLPQEPWLSLDPTMKARDQVAESYRHVAGYRKADAQRLATQAMTHLGLVQAQGKFPFELSGGMAQRVAFAATHAGGARLMIADEPTKGLDRARIGEVIGLLRAGLEDGGALLIITHDLEVALRLGGEVMIMLEGQVIESGSAGQVLGQPVEVYTKRLIAADPERWPVRATPKAAGVAVRTGANGVVLQVRDLAVQRGGRRLFEGLCFDIRAGEILGVTGASGCGKSSLGDALLGLVPLAKGSITSALSAPKVRFQKLYQDPVAAFAPSLSLGRCLEDLVRLHRLDAGQIPILLRRLRLAPGLLERLPGEVSGGELQRLSLLRVLLLKPAFIFADEPSSRLDLITQQEMIELLVEVARDSGTAVLLVSHDIALIDAVSDSRLQLNAAPSTEHGESDAMSPSTLPVSSRTGELQPYE